MAPRPHAETTSDATEQTHGALHFRAHLKSQRCRENQRWSTKQTETHQQRGPTRICSRPGAIPPSMIPTPIPIPAHLFDSDSDSDSSHLGYDSDSDSDSNTIFMNDSDSDSIPTPALLIF